MLHVKDLMIGDLVNYRPGWINEETNQVEYESSTGFPVRIEMLYYSHREGLVQYNDGENDGIEAAEYELFPIPLTPETLEKNKLLKHDGFELDFSRHHRLKVILLWTDAKGISRPQITFYLPKPQYVHELQHSLRLCGIEKEIIL